MSKFVSKSATREDVVRAKHQRPDYGVMQAAKDFHRSRRLIGGWWRAAGLTNDRGLPVPDHGLTLDEALARSATFDQGRGTQRELTRQEIQAIIDIKRTHRHMTQRQAADVLGVARSSVQRIWRDNGLIVADADFADTKPAQQNGLFGEGEQQDGLFSEGELRSVHDPMSRSGANYAKHEIGLLELRQERHLLMRISLRNIERTRAMARGRAA